MTKIKEEGWSLILVGLAMAVFGSLNLPLPFFWGAVTFLGGLIAGLAGVFLHHHDEE